MLTNKHLITLLFASLIFTMSSCQVIGDIFNAGVWVGILIVVVIIGIIIWLIGKIGKK